MRWMALAMMVLAACQSTAEPEITARGEEASEAVGDRVLVLGTIAGYRDGDPDIGIVTSGRSATVRVTTYGGGCHSKGPTEVVVEGTEVLVTPYDYTEPAGTPCTRILNVFTHEATVTFGGPADAVIRVLGIDMSRASAEDMDGDTLVVSRTVHVR